MGHSATRVLSNDFALGVGTACTGRAGARNVDGREVLDAQKEAVQHARGRIRADDVTTGIHPESLGPRRAWDIER